MTYHRAATRRFRGTADVSRLSQRDIELIAASMLASLKAIEPTPAAPRSAWFTALLGFATLLTAIGTLYLGWIVFQWQRTEAVQTAERESLRWQQANCVDLAQILSTRPKFPDAEMAKQFVSGAERREQACAAAGVNLAPLRAAVILDHSKQFDRQTVAAARAVSRATRAIPVRTRDRFYLGEPQFRGFDIRGVGPRVSRTGAGESITTDQSLDEALGLGASADYLRKEELEIPLGNGKGSVWVQAGSLYGVNWTSPFGPLRADIEKLQVPKNYDVGTTL